jgi:hypothetical protein
MGLVKRPPNLVVNAFSSGSESRSTSCYYQGAFVGYSSHVETFRNYEDDLNKQTSARLACAGYRQGVPNVQAEQLTY